MMIYAAFMLGLFGSLHCLGMCGPIAFALPVRTTSFSAKVLKYLLYNYGRILTYSLLGLIAGTIGKGFAMAGFQQTVSILTGIVIILSVVVIHNPLRNLFVDKLSFKIREKLKHAFHYYFQKSEWYSLFVLGILNGLLPCGLVYAALAGAMAGTTPASGAFFMMVFGIGTMPMMMAVGLSKTVVGNKLRTVFTKVTPVLACVIGVLLIMRGMNLDIPFVSPGISGGTVHKCH